MLRFKFLFDVVAPSLILFWAAILGYSAVFSDTGYLALTALRAEAAALGGEVDQLHERRVMLEKRANLLRSKSLDPDLADERIRAILGYSREGDIIVQRSELERLLAGDP